MRQPLYAMDTNFYHSLGAYDFDVRCEMLVELGYDATYLTLWSEPAWADAARLATVKARYGLDVASVYAILDVANGPEFPANRRIADLLQTIDGCATIELAMRSSDDRLATSDAGGDEAARRLLEPMLAIAAQRDLTLALYPHVNFWLERIEDAVRLCRAIDHPRLRMVFCGYHWYAVDGTRLSALLTEAAPFLVSANLCGSSRLTNGGRMPATIEPLDEGELDNFAVLGALRATGFSGMVGIQGYSVGGDVYAKLRRSLAAFRDIERRLNEHPRWAALRPPRME